MTDRIYKINELIKEEVGKLMLRELGDHKGFITVTAVETTPDLHYSTVWYSVIGESDKLVADLIKNSSKDIQKNLNKRLNLKHVPKIDFRLDNSGDYANKINKLINEANKDIPKE